MGSVKLSRFMLLVHQHYCVGPGRLSSRADSEPPWGQLIIVTLFVRFRHGRCQPTDRLLTPQPYDGAARFISCFARSLSYFKGGGGGLGTSQHGVLSKEPCCSVSRFSTHPHHLVLILLYQHRPHCALC